jgi:peptidoglycan/xylan/chitin deacetylase (PgdA/CDA1 family)
MPAQRQVGMDHEHYNWSPLSRRGVLCWPDQARVAVGVLVNLEHTEWRPPEGSVQVVTSGGGLGARPFPDYARLSHREYGHRVGIFRLLDVLEKHGLQATVAMDALTAEYYPYLVRHCLERGCEIIGHGISASQMITSKMSEAAERDYITTAIARHTRAIGQAPAGWFGPEYGESARTPQLLAQAGIRYVCDWANDEQPYRIKTPRGELFALPLMLELDDLHAMGERHVPITRYAALLVDSFEQLYRDGRHNGRLFMLHLHPWLSGQPFRIRYLDTALATIMRRHGVWAASGSTIIDWYQHHPAVAS